MGDVETLENTGKRRDSYHSLEVVPRGWINTIIYDQGRTVDNIFFRELIAFLQINGIGITTSAGGRAC